MQYIRINTMVTAKGGASSDTEDTAHQQTNADSPQQLKLFQNLFKWPLNYSSVEHLSHVPHSYACASMRIGTNHCPTNARCINEP